MTIETILTKTPILHSHLQTTISIMANLSGELLLQEMLPSFLKFDRTKIVQRLETIIAETCLKDNEFNAGVEVISRLTLKKDKEKMLIQHCTVHRLLFAKQCAQDIVDDPLQYIN